MKRFLAWLRRLTCDHHVYVEDINRVSESEVRCPCNRCEKVLTAEYGLALPGTLERKKPILRNSAPKPGEVVGSYRLASDGDLFIVQRLTDRTIWPMCDEPEWCQISSPATRERAEATMEYFRKKDADVLWRRVEQ